MTYEEAMAFVFRFSRQGSPIQRLDRFSELMARLGDPQEGMKFIHIAGTNGKGSVAEYISRAADAAGMTVGEFTSPYITSYTDRIKINGKNIDEEALAAIIEKIAAAEPSPLCSQFEITTAAAFLYFAEKKCDVTVLEVGIGGLLDATNIIKEPLVSVICTLGLDHMALLGETIERIAQQKAGIIKKGCPCVLSEGNPEEAVNVVKTKAEQLGSELTIPEKPEHIIGVGVDGAEFIYKDREFHITMAGTHQLTNACTAIEAIHASGLPISLDAIRIGLEKAMVPARGEIFRRSPLVMLDGAHNPNGMKALAGIMAQLPRKPIFVCGMLRDKNAPAALFEVVPYINRAITVGGFYRGSLTAGEVANIFRCFGVNSAPSALETAVKEAIIAGEREDRPVIFGGSLYLASQIRPMIMYLKEEE